MTPRLRLLSAVLGATTLLAAGTASTQAGDSPPRPMDKPSIEQLIDRLNSDDFPTREAATRALLERDDAVPALRRALRSELAEVRRRAKQILDQRQAQEKEKRVQQLLAHLKNGEVDQFVERMTALGEDDDRIWREVRDLAQRLVVKANKTYRCGLRVPWAQNDPFAMHFSKIGSEKRVYCRRGMARQPVDCQAIQRSILVCQGGVQANEFDWNVILANGDVICPKVDPLFHCIVSNRSPHFTPETTF